MKLCLGTVQFGMDYGINGQKKPARAAAIDILDYAVNNGITTFDTANAYGDAEEVLGEFLKCKKIVRSELRLFSKLKPNILENKNESEWYSLIRDNLENSLQRLGIDYLDGYLLHTPRYVFNRRIVEILNGLKDEGIIKKIGVSIYYQDEAEKGLQDNMIDTIQIPYSIFDQRLEKGGFFNKREIANKEILSRSAFLQGLILMNEKDVPPFLTKSIPVIRKMNELCEKYQISKAVLALNYVKRQTVIDYLVFGVDNLEQLKEIISASANKIDDEFVSIISKEFNGLDSDIIIPSLWSR